MDKLDRLGWAVEATVVVNGVWVGLRVNHADLWARLLERLPGGAQLVSSDTFFVDLMVSAVFGGEVDGGRRPFHFGYLNFKRVARTTDPVALLDQVAAVLGGRLEQLSKN